MSVISAAFHPKSSKVAYIPGNELDAVHRDHRLAPHELGSLRRVDHLTVNEFQIAVAAAAGGAIVKLDELAGVEGGPLGLAAAARGRSGGHHDAGDELELAIFPPDATGRTNFAVENIQISSVVYRFGSINLYANLYILCTHREHKKDGL